MPEVKNRTQSCFWSLPGFTCLVAGFALTSHVRGAAEPGQPVGTGGVTPESPAAIRIQVDAAAPGKSISPDLIGIFFEDISRAADGGLYAELVQNRSFEYSALDAMDWTPLTAWESVSRGGARGSLRVMDAVPVHENNRQYLVVETRDSGAGFGLLNTGFDGIPVRAGERYEFSVFARQLFTGTRWDGTGRLDSAAKLLIRLETPSGESIGDAEVEISGREWQRVTASITADGSEDAARLVLLAPTQGAIALDVVSLFPRETFMNRPNGLRADLARVIAGLKPKFVRFPGGCLVHGWGLGNLYRWKDTIGPIEQRRGQPNIWGYHQSVGLGYFEYFQFCEDIGAKPLPVVAAGVCCQNADYQGGTGQRGIPLDEMPAYIQEVLDLIEWANGPADSTWGARRAAAGHPEPFNLEYLGVGNEDHITPVFRERFRMIFEAIRARHPEITVVGTVGPAPDGEDYENGWQIANELGVPMVDEHYYRPPRWFWDNLERYDRYDRSQSKVYVGEYAAHDDGRRTTLRSALAEAAYLTGLERNADVVPFASYAPMLAKRGRTDWNPNLIYFSNTEIVPTINYYVQQLFSLNGGDTYLPAVRHEPAPVEPDAAEPGDGIFLGTWNTQAEFDDVVVSNRAGVVLEEDFESGPAHWRPETGDWSVSDGVYRQLGTEQPAISRLAIRTGGTPYTLRLRARRTGGAEGFLIGLRAQDDDNFYWWNLGGWGNTRTAVEKSSGGRREIVGETQPAGIELNRWHDLRVEVDADRIRCYLDGELRHEFADAGFADSPDVAFSSVREGRTGDLILKVVNGAGEPQPVHFKIANAASLASEALMTVLGGVDPLAVNDFSNPRRVVPQTATIPVGATLRLEVPANSLSVIRIPKR